MTTPIPNPPPRVEPPPGLKSLIDHCLSIYPDQPNPLQVTTVLKYWLGGQDPLDYISMYLNKGDPERGIPAHWHYISFGLSDLHGDGRVHVVEPLIDGVRTSGIGFELTFRLIKTENASSGGTEKQDRPPTWPANLLQALARYCFQTGNRFYAGDNVPWRKALDGSNSLIQNILMAQDPQLGPLDSPFGTVEFCQVVGVTEEEIEQASRWNGKGVLNFLMQDNKTGGDFLITDMSRSQSVFELFPETLLSLLDDLEKQGSDLAGVNAEFTFREIPRQNFKEEIDSETLNEQCQTQDNNNPLTNSIREGNNFLQSMSTCNSLQMSCPVDYQPNSPNCIPLDGIEITLAPYAAKFLLLSIKDRIRHGRHFTFKSQNLALTFVAESVTGSAVTKEFPFGVVGYWIQVMITDDLVPRMIETFQNSLKTENTENNEKLEFEFPDKNLKIIIGIPQPSTLSLDKK